jgi:hypothetical protein
MINNSPNGFYARCVDCKVYYNKGFFDYEINKLEIIKDKNKYFKNSDMYILNFIDNIKHNIIKKLPNLKLVLIDLAVFDKNNILHRFIVTISNLIQDLLKFKNKIDIYKSVLVSVLYENKIMFMGGINFTGLV